MTLVWRLITTELKRHWKGMTIMIVVALLVSATPYGFAMLGRWLVDDVLQVTRTRKIEAVDSQPSQPPPEEAERETSTPSWETRTTEGQTRLLLIFFIGSIGIHVVVTGISILSALVNQQIVQRITHRLRRQVHEKLGSMDMAVFCREQVGQLMSRVMDDTAGIPGNLTQLVVNVLTQTGMLFLGTYLLLRMNPTMTLIALVALPFYGITCLYFLPRIRRNTEDLRVKGAAFNGFLVERLTNIATIKNYAQEDREVQNFSERLEKNLSLARRQNKLNLIFNTLTTLITAAATLGVLTFGFLNIRAGRMELGEVLAFNGITAQLFVPISALVSMAAVGQTLRVLAQRVYTILDTEGNLTDAPDAREPESIKGALEFENVSLRYQEGGPFAVRNVNLNIAAGSTTCIVGPTGCGKTTLLLLLARLYDPTEGSLRLDGVDIRKIPVRIIRRAVAQVLPECPVFTGSVADNIAFGAPDTPQNRIEEVARMVGLHDFIKELKAGYKTMLGRGEVTFDAEHLARLGLARAIIVDPAVVTIDDTYATIEESIERPLRAAVRNALPDCTILVATSRLSVCEDADRVVVMQKGQVVQCDTHTALLETPGIYRRMYMRQMGWEDESENV